MPVQAAAQLVDQSVDGRQRVCTYRDGASGSMTRTHRVGVGNSCPVLYPAADPNRGPPPSARLASSAESNGQRICTYSQSSGMWRLTIPLSERCPLAAGMVKSGEGANQE
jgi:hypothetical protein